MPSVIGSRYGFATYGYRSAMEPGAYYNQQDFLLFLNAIGITDQNRAISGGFINLRFPAVDTDILSFLPSSPDGQRLIISDQTTYPSFAASSSHTAQTLVLDSDRGYINFGGSVPPPGYFYACGDSKGIAIFLKSGVGNNYLFQYFGYCDQPASVFAYGNSNSYTLDYIGGFDQNESGIIFRRQKNLRAPGLPFGGTQSVIVKTSIDCATVTPGADASDVIFLDNGVTDYGIDYPLGKARPFLLYTSDNSLPVNSLTKVTGKTTGNEFYLIVATVTGGGRLMMPLVTENITMSS